MRPRRFALVSIAVLTLAACSEVSAQVAPWDSFADTISNSVCSVVNAGNAKLVVLRATGQLVSVGGSDVILEETFVDAQGFVFFEEEPAGLLDFATDGDGFRTLWWLTLTGNVVEVDDFEGVPVGTNLTPADFENVPCDACEFWDDPSVCEVPPPTIPICGVDVPIPMTLSLLGLTVLRFARSRFAR